MKLSKSKLKEIIMEVLQEEDAYEMGAPDEDETAVVVDMMGNSFSVEKLRAALDDEEFDRLKTTPKSYYVQIKNGKIAGVGPEE